MSVAPERPLSRRRHRVLIHGLLLVATLTLAPWAMAQNTRGKADLPNADTATRDVAQDDTQTTLTIGFAGPLSGSAAGVGRSMQNAVQLALEEAEQRGLRVAGKRIRFRLIAQDDRADPAAAEYVARYLVGQHAIAVVGHWTSGTSLVAAPIYHAAGVIQVSPSAMSRKLTQLSYPRMFRTIPNNESMGRLSAQYAVGALGAKTLVTIDDRTPFGNGLTSEFAQAAERMGVRVAAQYSVSDKTSDFNSALMQARKLQPDLIFFGGLDWQAGVLAKSVRRLKLSARLMASAGTVGLTFLMRAGADANGTLVLEPGPPQDKMAGWKSFRQRYAQRFDSDIDLYAVFAHDAAQAIINGIRRAGSTDPDAIALAMHRLRFEGIGGPVAFNEEGDLLHPSFTMYEVQDQRWHPVARFNGLPR